MLAPSSAVPYGRPPLQNDGGQSRRPTASMRRDHVHHGAIVTEFAGAIDAPLVPPSFLTNGALGASGEQLTFDYEPSKVAQNWTRWDNTIMAQIAFLLLDCDGVLVNSEELSESSELQVLSELGLHIDQIAYRDMILGRPENVHIDDLVQRLAAQGVSLSPNALSEKLREARWNEYRAGLEMIEGMASVLDLFSDRLIIVSSSDQQSVREKLRLAGRTDADTLRVIGDDDAAGTKADSYRTAARLSGQPRRSILAVEDSPAGISAAVEAGIPTWGLAQRSHPAASDMLACGASRVFTQPLQLEQGLIAALS